MFKHIIGGDEGRITRFLFQKKIKKNVCDCRVKASIGATNCKMTRTEFLRLLEKYKAGECTPEEMERLNSYQDDFLQDIPWTADMGDERATGESISKNLHRQIGRRQHVVILKRWSVAAALLLAGAGVFWFNIRKPALPTKPSVAKTSHRHQIKPGGNKAILTLANGTSIDLTDSHEGVITLQQGVAVKKADEGKLVYAADTRGENSAISYNTISTPRGGQYEVVLSDGTHVWLNAASTLKFPAAFKGKERKVELTGEAYFEVAKNKKMPFKVLANGTEVQVLGTHFNVMAYSDEKAVETTLLEGSVKLYHTSGAEAVLQPGQQGLLETGKPGFQVHSVNTSDIVAWKNGYFVFDNENIQDIMRQISRWYDIDVTYSGNITNKNFGGSVSRFSNVSEVLNLLELTGTIHFKVSERRITVMP